MVAEAFTYTLRLRALTDDATLFMNEPGNVFEEFIDFDDIRLQASFYTDVEREASTDFKLTQLIVAFSQASQVHLLLHGQNHLLLKLTIGRVETVGEL